MTPTVIEYRGDPKRYVSVILGAIDPIIKRVFTDRSNAAWDRKAGEAAAIRKCVFTDRSNAAWNGKAGEAVATFKCTFINRSDAA